MDFPEFVELFKSFYFHARRDLKDLFDKFASEINLEQDYTIKDQYKHDCLDISRHLTGLITRNIAEDITDASVRRIYDMIAISSIPCYAISTHTRGNYLITKEQFRDFLVEHQKEDKTSYEIEQIIYVSQPRSCNARRRERADKHLSYLSLSLSFSAMNPIDKIVSTRFFPSRASRVFFWTKKIMRSSTSTRK